MVARLGMEIDDPSSICYWAARNGIPVFCPALTDGSLGDMLFFHTYKNPGLVLDIVADIRAINDEALKAAPRKTGMIILGGGALRCQANALTVVRYPQQSMTSSCICCWHRGLPMRHG